MTSLLQRKSLPHRTYTNKTLLGLVMALLCHCAMAQLAPIANQFITKSANGQYLVNSITNTPVYLTGEDAFYLTEALCSADVASYFNDRQARGFNAIWVSAADINATTNCNGDHPFNGANFTNFNTAYWAYVDFVVQAASARGITMVFNPAFVGLNSSQGYLTDFSNAALGSTFTAYGTFLGNRYKNQNNIIWLLGGDADLTNATVKTNIGLLATAIAAADPNHLLTFEGQRLSGNQSSYTAYSNSPPSWLGLNWSYDIQSTITTANGCPLTYTQSSTLPPLEGEDWYELEHSMTSFQVRQEGYWATLTGCFLGRIFGNTALWTFNIPASGFTSQTWQSQLGSAGSVGQQYLGKLMRSRSHWLMVPDSAHSVLTGGIGAGATLNVAACASDGSSCIVYDSSGSTTPPQIAMSHFSGTVHAWWYNPQTSATTDLGTFANTGTRTFTASDTNDWALVLDLASLNLAAPGVVAPWKNILTPSRAVDWIGAGLPAVFPNGETTVNPWTPPTRPACTTAQAGITVPVAAGTSIASVTTALTNCKNANPSGSYLLLGAGTFSYSSGNLVLPSYVTVRSSGPMSTTLALSGTAAISFGQASGAGAANWTGAIAGTSSIAVTGATGLTPTVGNLVRISQNNLAADNGGLWICSGNTNPACGQQASVSSRQSQIARITSITGTSPNFTFNIDPPIIASNWSSSLNPIVEWEDPNFVKNGVGLEDMTISGLTTNNQFLDASFCYGCWVQGNRFIGSGSTYVMVMSWTLHPLIANNYFFSDPNLDAIYPSPIKWQTSTQGLGVNNISASSVSWEGEGGNEGNVWAYNYARDTFTPYMEDIFFDHSGGSMFHLFEGDQAGAILRDNTFNTAPLQTTFRNYLSGWASPYVQTQCCYALALDAFARFSNDIGNALGDSNSTTSYQSTIALPTAKPIYRYVTNPATNPTDQLTQDSSLRWGNCDTVTGTCRFQSAEIPTTLTGNAGPYNNLVPASNTLPCSLFMPGCATPSWWKVCTAWTVFPTSCATSQTQPYPAVGPDVTGGPYVSGHAYDNPAAIAFKALPIDASRQFYYPIASSSWSAGTETLTFAGGVLANVTHLMGPFQIAGACGTGSGEVYMTASSSTTVKYALASNPGSCAGATMKFPDIRQFDQRVFGPSVPLGPPAPTGLTAVVH